LELVQATEFLNPDHAFHPLNELPKGAGEILKSLAIDCPRKVIGIRQIKNRPAVMSAHAKSHSPRWALLHLALRRGLDWRAKNQAWMSNISLHKDTGNKAGRWMIGK